MERQGAAQWLGLAGWIAVTLAAAAVGSQFMPGEWYASLEKPAWNPPSWVFGPVWTTLYLLMAIAAWLVWRAHGFAGAAAALTLYLVQLAANAAWSWLFFGRRDPGLAFADIVLLWVLIAFTIVLFHQRHRTAALLLVPYLLWVSFATALNFAIWRLNA